MIYRECTISENELFHISDHEHYYANPYYGCSEGCPFCYWLQIPGWEGQTSIRINAVEQFDKAMMCWDIHKRICFGSYCNPYESVERQYRLTRGMLEVVKKRGIPFMLTTSSELILDDAELIASMRDQAVIVFELSRMERLDNFKRTGVHPVLDAANKLSRMGVTVFATLSPYLKGITEIDPILAYLDHDIPLYLGKLDLETTTMTATRLLSSIKNDHEELLPYYLWLVKDGNVDAEFYELMKKYVGNPRIREFPLNVQYENCVGGLHNG